MQGSGKIKKAFIAGYLALIFFSADAQSFKDHIDKGDRYFQKKDYKNALESYLKALGENADDAQTNFKTGISFLHEENFSQAVIHLEKAYNARPDVDPNIDYHLATAYQRDHQYAKARVLFEAFKARNKKLSAVANQKILECVVGDSLMKHHLNPAEVHALGGEINTSFSEFFPIITPEGNLIFTSDRATEQYQIKSGSNGEDVYISEQTAGQWAPPRKISESINVKLNDAAVSISNDGKTIFLNYEEGGGDIYTSAFQNGAWTRPVPLNRFINHPQYRESAACVSPDGKRLYFSSNRPGGKGGFDIYVCALGANGEWGRPANLGSPVNTRQDEESPFAHADGITLYFSSNGQATLGDHDIFRTAITNGKWSAPENLGFPVNTSGYEGYFVISSDGQTGYFSSRRGAGRSNLDIYKASFPRESTTSRSSGLNTTAEQAASHRNPKMVTVLKGKVIDVADTRPLEATLSLVDHSTKKTISKITTGPSGDFELVIPRGGNYGVTTEKAGYLFNSMNFNLPEFEKYQEIDTHVLMVKAEVGSKVVLKNIFFDLNQSALKAESLSELENIRDLLKSNPGLRVQINGHTDNVGHPTINRALSLKRAQSVVEYLIQQGISADRLEAQGFGSERPLVSNDDEAEGRQINRRTEIEIIK